jgi:hypothetical protein
MSGSEFGKLPHAPSVLALTDDALHRSMTVGLWV